MTRILTILTGLALSVTAGAQGTSMTGAMQSYNDGKTGAVRTLQYRPVDGDFVCLNGQNRFTRALYGGWTAWRVETSDRPVFALFKSRKECRNISLRLLYGGRSMALDSTEVCEARYGNAARTYRLSDSRWGTGRVEVKVVASHDREQAVWRVTTDGFNVPVRLQAVLSHITAKNFSRNGDLGADKPGGYEATDRIGALEWDGRGTTYFAARGLELVQADMTLPTQFCAAEQAGRELAGRISFSTPDAYINTLGGALAVAADGDWDGQTWLHGAIGWRMPLAGWRAAYAGDVLGWPERAVSHFDAYAQSQVTSVPATRPHPSQDPKMNMARAEKEWGTQMYSNGYICRNPGRNDQMHHYDMNLNYIDELLWHFEYDADTAYMRRMWPIIKSHLAWEKRNYDSDGDHLYDAYCCIWASDALYYSGGAVTHSSAYNYRGNRLAARIAELIGEDPRPYQQEAEAILAAMNSRLWLQDKGVWAEFQDGMGLKRLHESPAVWSVYTPVDCGACSPQQAWQATDWVTREIPHIAVEDSRLSTIGTSNWLPYAWSINNVAPAEVMHTALAYFEAGRSDEGYQLLKANLLDNMYYGQSPANFGQLSHYDAARGECYRDFGDVIGISSRALIQGLFGVVPNALEGRCVIRPGFPASWDSVSLKTPYIEYKYTRVNGTGRYEITQNFTRPLKMVVRKHLGNGQWADVEGTDARTQVIEVVMPDKMTAEDVVSSPSPAHPALGESQEAAPLQASVPGNAGKGFRCIPISAYFNAEVDDIFRNRYTSPRPAVTTLQIPLQGVGEWCHPTYCPEINDSVFRTLITNGRFTVADVPFLTPAEGSNIVYTSLWDNYPDSVVIPLRGRASVAHLLMAGSTNHMQCRIDNGLVVATYRDGTTDTLRLRNPDNWCPIEQDFYVDGQTFQAPEPRPYRVCLGTGTVSRDLGQALRLRGVYGREIPGGAAQMLSMSLDPRKKLRSLTVRTLSNDVVIGLMGVSLQK